MSLLEVTLGVLGVWRLTHLLHTEDGPWDLVVRLRRLAGTGVIGRAMDCFDCLSLWIALPCAWMIGATWRERALACLALSGSAMIVNRLVTRLEAGPRALYQEDPEAIGDVQLRTDASERFHAA